MAGPGAPCLELSVLPSLSTYCADKWLWKERFPLSLVNAECGRVSNIRSDRGSCEVLLTLISLMNNLETCHQNGEKGKNLLNN